MSDEMTYVDALRSTMDKAERELFTFRLEDLEHQLNRIVEIIAATHGRDKEQRKAAMRDVIRRTNLALAQA